MQLWIDLILDYSKATKVYEYDVMEASKSPLFANQKINRKLNGDGIRIVFEELVIAGNGEWQGKEKNRVTVFWRRPEEWGNLIYKWVSDNGKLGTVLTIYELREGDDVSRQEFYQLDQKVMMKALQSLEKQKKAEIFSASEDSIGVKFFQ